MPPDRQNYLEKKEREEVKRVILQRVSQEKNLRITIDETLNFEQIINQTIGLISRSFSYLSSQFKL